MSTTQPTEWYRLQNWFLDSMYTDGMEPKATLPREQLLKCVFQGCTPPGASAIHGEARKTQLVPIKASHHRNKGTCRCPNLPGNKKTMRLPTNEPDVPHTPGHMQRSEEIITCRTSPDYSQQHLSKETSEVVSTPTASSALPVLFIIAAIYCTLQGSTPISLPPCL